MNWKILQFGDLEEKTREVHRAVAFLDDLEAGLSLPAELLASDQVLKPLPAYYDLCDSPWHNVRRTWSGRRSLP